jgi:hypothetical protein
MRAEVRSPLSMLLNVRAAGGALRRLERRRVLLGVQVEGGVVASVMEGIMPGDGSGLGEGRGLGDRNDEDEGRGSGVGSGRGECERLPAREPEFKLFDMAFVCCCRLCKRELVLSCLE